jgi:hypothetical protein
VIEKMKLAPARRPDHRRRRLGRSGRDGDRSLAWRDAIVAGTHRPTAVEHFIDASSSDVREAVLEITEGRGADMVLDRWVARCSSPLSAAAFRRPDGWTYLP